MTARQPVFYGWFIVAACFAATMCIGEVLWSFGVFFEPLETEFSWSRSLTSTGFTALLIGHGISGIVAGRLADRYTARPIMLASALFAGPAIALCSQIHTPLQLQGFLFLAGLSTGATLSVPTSAVLRWFRGRAHGGMALAIVMSGVGVGALVFAPLLSYLITSFGWRTAFIVAGAVFFSIVGGAALVMRPSPGERERSSTPGRHSSADTPRPPIGRLVGTRQFAGLAGITMVTFFAAQILLVHLVPWATDSGISAHTAAVALGLIGGFSVPGRLISGFLSERLGWRTTLVIAIVGAAVAFFGLPLVDQTWTLYCFVALYGMCHGTRAVAVIGLLGHVFGTRSLGELIGITIAVAQLFGAMGPYVAGYLFDRLQTYSSTFIALGALLALTALLALKLKTELSAERSDAAS